MTLLSIATFKNVLNMAVLEERLNKTHIEKMGREFWAMYQCILNKPLWSDWSGGLCSLVHGSPVHKALSSKSLNWISATIFAEFIQFGQDLKLKRPRTFWRENSMFHWRKISSQFHLHFSASFPFYFPSFLYIHRYI